MFLRSQLCIHSHYCLVWTANIERTPAAHGRLDIHTRRSPLEIAALALFSVVVMTLIDVDMESELPASAVVEGHTLEAVALAGAVDIPLYHATNIALGREVGGGGQRRSLDDNTVLAGLALLGRQAAKRRRHLLLRGQGRPGALIVHDAGLLENVVVDERHLADVLFGHGAGGNFTVGRVKRGNGELVLLGHDGSPSQRVAIPHLTEVSRSDDDVGDGIGPADQDLRPVPYGQGAAGGPLCLTCGHVVTEDAGKPGRVCAVGLLASGKTDILWRRGSARGCSGPPGVLGRNRGPVVRLRLLDGLPGGVSVEAQELKEAVHVLEGSRSTADSDRFS